MLKVIERPGEPITLQQAKDHLRIFHDDEDALIEQKLKSARAYAENTLIWRALAEQTLEYILPEFKNPIKLLRPPLIEVVSINYIDPAGDEQTLSADKYEVNANTEPAEIKPVNSWPAGSNVKVRFKAGWPKEEGAGDDPDDYGANIPEDIINGLLLLTAHYYEMREPVVIGQTVNTIPATAEALLLPHRAWGCEGL